VGLLDKTLKKAGLERKKEENLAPKAEEKPAVKWLGRSFGERAKALADKMNLEAQYEHLETLAKATTQTPPPKTSLRERAKRFLTGFTGTPTPVDSDAEIANRPKLSLRERAKLLLKKVTGGGTDGSAGTPSANSGSSDLAGSGEPHSLSAEELPEQHFFPWFALTDEGTLAAPIAFGEEPRDDITSELESSQPIDESTQSSDDTTLNRFAETVERISENLKNLHVQLDGASLIRELGRERSGAPAQLGKEPQAELISHHVAEGSGTVSETQAAPRGETGALENAHDVFWPKNLPLDLPARDIKMNPDGTLSVVPGPFQLPYLAEDIAHPESEISHFTRNLKNAELFIGEGELQLTRIIYERLLVKIIDDEARRKIRANLDALDNYKKSHDWGNFMPLPPWAQRNPWADTAPRVNVSQMPVEAQNITINMDKGFFEIAKAIFELKKTLDDKLEDKKAEVEADGGDGDGHPGEIDENDQELGEQVAEEAAGEGQSEEQRSEGDRRKSKSDLRGDGAPERRSGRDRREDQADGDGDAAADETGTGAAEAEEKVEENAAPPPLAADGAAAAEPPAPEPEAMPDGLLEKPQMPDMAPDGQASAPGGGDEDGGSGEEKEEENKVQEIRGVLELKTPDQEDTPFLTLTYDFTKIPHAYRLAKDNGIFEYAYYKYKPMLVKAHQFIKRKQITRALNYYRVIREQQIPGEFRHMVDRNIKDITEYLQKYLVTRAN